MGKNKPIEKMRKKELISHIGKLNINLDKAISRRNDLMCCGNCSEWVNYCGTESVCELGIKHIYSFNVCPLWKLDNMSKRSINITDKELKQIIEKKDGRSL
jgi:hypothetical protein